jgi:hypothetical protein
MTGVIDQAPTINQTSPFLHDGRVFYPVFEDGGESYSRLIEAVQHKTPADKLQRLIEKLATENEGQTEHFPEGLAPHTFRAPQLRYLKLRAAALLLRDLVQQAGLFELNRGRLLYILPLLKRRRSD